MLRAALAYADLLGWSVFPLARGSKIPLANSNGCHDATTDPATLRTWWHAHPGANVGLGCGPSGLVVVDLDRKGGVDGLRAWLDLVQRLDIAEGRPPVARTPSGGLHLVYGAGGYELGNSNGKLGPGIDTKSAGGYVVLAPSTLDNGCYRWLDNRRPTDGPIPVLPARVAEALLPIPASRQAAPMPTVTSGTAYARAALAGELGRVRGAKNGRRNHTLNAAAFALGTLTGGGLLDRSEVAGALEAAALAVGLGEREAQATIASGLDAGELKPREIPRPTGTGRM